jgi:hypothetical protein
MIISPFCKKELITWSIIAELYSLYEQTASHRKYFHFPRK